MMSILSDSTKFKEVPENSTQSRLKLFQDWMCRHKHLFGASYESIYPSSSRTPILYGQPKIHKENYPLKRL